jgi:hypothetical protein
VRNNGDNGLIGRSEAVVWQEPGGPLGRGRLEIGPRELLLAGTDPEGHALRIPIAYVNLRGVRLGDLAGETIDGRRALVFDRVSGPPVLLSTVSSAGVLLEVADVLSRLVAHAMETASRVAVVVPLRRGARDRVRELVDRGPPFDLALFDRHHVFVTDKEAVFFFEGENVRGAIEQVLSSPVTWREAAAWSRLVSGPPRIADEEYAAIAGRRFAPNVPVAT